jgi:ABC-type uncharacterized transport system permease subunit
VSFLLSLLSAGLYCLTSVLLYRSLSSASLNASDERGSRRQKARWIATVALLLHAMVVFQYSGLPHDLSLPVFTAVAATTLTIVVLLILLCLRQPADYLGVAVYPIAAVSVLSIHYETGNSQIVGEAIQIHVFLSLLSYGVLALAAAQAVLVSIQRRKLSKHKPGGFMRLLPPLDSTEDLLFTLLFAGFALLTLSLVSGFFFLENMFAQHLVHKTVLSCMGWAIFAGLIFGRWKFGWRGKKAVTWTLAGFATLILAYFGSKIVLEILLK